MAVEEAGASYAKAVEAHREAQKDKEVKDKVEEKDLKDITKDGSTEKIDFRPGELLGNLYTLFSGLKKKLPSENGRYLLSHDSRTGPFVKVWRASDTKENQVSNC